MSTLNSQSPDYGNWVAMKLVYTPSILGVLFLALAFLFPPLIAVTVLFFAVSVYFAYARYQFSPRGGNVQPRIQGLLLNRLDWNGQGQVIDIGCGNAPLTIAIAKKFPAARVIGIDYWGGTWEYAKGTCENNAEREGVAHRVAFKKASAAALPFDDESFEAAVSNLVFHEVRDAKDKRALVKEALRVVKRGGAFAFQDLFKVQRMYGEIDDLLADIRSWGIECVEFVDTSNAKFIPRPLKLPFMVGTMSILYGKK